MRKCRAGADFAITQMFFYADDYLRLRDRVAAAGCDVPIIPGIMPVDQRRADRAVRAAVERRVPARAGRAAARASRTTRTQMRKVGVEAATELCERLLAEGVPGLHFITLNRSTATREIYEQLGLRDRR